MAMLATVMLLLVSCIKDGRDESCPADLRVVYNWDEVNPLLDSDSLMIIGKDGRVYYFETSTRGTDLDLPDGEYCMVAYEGNPNVDIERENVTVKSKSNGSLNELTPFRAGINNFIIKAAETTGPLEIVMRRQTRLLQIKIHFIGNGLEFLNGVTGNLTGVTLSRKIEHGFPPADREPRHPAIASATAGFSFDRTVTRSGDVSLQQDFNSEKRLLGLDGNIGQQLNLTLQLGNLTRELNLNLTETDKKLSLLRFHVDKVEEPFLIEITIQLGADMVADIVDWNSGSESDMDAQ